MSTPEAMAPPRFRNRVPCLSVDPGLIPVRGAALRAVLRESRCFRVPSMLAS